jgi:hypothetical protein
MSKISELQAGMQRCDEELRALRESLAPAENEQHQRVKELRTEWLTAFERLQMMQPYLRIANYEVDTEVAYADYFRAVQSGDRERDAALEDDLRAEVRRAAPTSLDDPRLVGWYHTVDLCIRPAATTSAPPSTGMVFPSRWMGSLPSTWAPPTASGPSRWNAGAQTASSGWTSNC